MQEENRGEADAVLQSQKAKQKSNLFFEDIVFLSNDEEALLMARSRSLSTLTYSDFKLSLREAGIALP